MAEKEVPVVRTSIPMDEFIGALVRVWPKVRDAVVTSGKMTEEQFGGRVPPKGATGVLFAQYMIETGGTSSFNFNIGNVKHTTGDGFDFHSLRGVWEGVSPSEAQRLISSGQAVPDPSADHAKAVGAGRVSVVFNPPHPATRFRAFATLDEGMTEQLKILAKRFGKAWPSVLAGDPTGFAHALKSMGYFTADANAYANGMRPSFNRAMASNAYDNALTALNAVADVVNPIAINVAKATTLGGTVLGTGLLGWGIFKWWTGRKKR